MSIENRIAALAAVLLVPLGGCENGIVDAGSGSVPPGLSSHASYGAWTAASSIEAVFPGAHEGFNTASVEGCPFVSRDGKSFFIASNRAGGLGGLDIWISTREHENAPWGEPTNPGAPVNSSSDDFCPTLDRNGQTLYFVSRRQDGVQGVDWCGGGDMYVTRRRADGTFEPARNLGCGVNSAAEEFSPFPLLEAASGPVLYFSSTREGLGAGGDLYVATWHGGAFGAPELVPVVNGPYDDGQPNVRRDGLELFFYSNRPDAGALGGNDIYVATRASVFEPWSTPVNLGSSVNSAASETRPSLSWDGTTLYFGSTRAGGEGASDVYASQRTRLPGADR